MKKVVYLIPILLIIAAIYFIPRYIKINEIKCRDQYGACNNVLVEKLEDLSGQNIPSTKQNIEQIVNKDATIDHYVVKYQLPDIFEIELVKKKGLFSLKSKNRDVYFLIDRDGHVISIEENSKLPGIEVEDALYNVGDSIDETYKFALDLLLDLFYTYKISQGVIKDDSLIVIMENGDKVMFPLEGDKQILLGSLSLIVSRLKDEAKDSKIEFEDTKIEIDLRYKNPVIRNQ